VERKSLIRKMLILIRVPFVAVTFHLLRADPRRHPGDGEDCLSRVASLEKGSTGVPVPRPLDRIHGDRDRAAGGFCSCVRIGIHYSLQSRTNSTDYEGESP